MNIDGMCCTITTGTGNAAGRAGKRAASALGPPVDTPMAMISMPPPGSPGRRDRQRRREGPRRRRDRRGDGGPSGERLDLGDEILAHGLEAGRYAPDVGRLGHVVGGPRRQRVQRGPGSALGERAEHNDRELWPRLAQFLERRDAVHVGHLDVQRHDIRVALRDLLQGDSAVGGRTHHLDLRVGGQHVAHQAANDDGVIDDEHPDPPQTDAPCELGRPRICSLASIADLVNGFMTYSWAPASIARTICAISVSVVTIIRRTSARRGSA